MASEIFYAEFSKIFEEKKNNSIIKTAEYDEIVALIKNPSKLKKGDFNMRNRLNR